MEIKQKIKMRVILFLMIVLVLLVILNPFIFSEEKTLVFFYSLEFLLAIFLWEKFNTIRIAINKKELEDEKIREIEHDIEELIK